MAAGLRFGQVIKTQPELCEGIWGVSQEEEFEMS